MAGIAAAEYLGYIDKTELDENLKSLDVALEGLRQGMFAPKNRGKLIEKTEEGIDISTTLLTKGYVADDEIERFQCDKKAGSSSGNGMYPEYTL